MSMNKYERFIMDKRELKRVEQSIVYWQEFMFLPKEKLQSKFYTPKLYSKNKSERKEYRKLFAYRVKEHSQEKAFNRYFELFTKLGDLAISQLTQLNQFNIIDKLIIETMESHPKSTVNRPSWHDKQNGKDLMKGFMDAFAHIGVDIGSQPDQTVIIKSSTTPGRQ